MAHGPVAVPTAGPVLPSQHWDSPAAHATRSNQARLGSLPGTCSGAHCWRPYGTSDTEDVACGLRGPDGLRARSPALAGERRCVGRVSSYLNPLRGPAATPAGG